MCIKLRISADFFLFFILAGGDILSIPVNDFITVENVFQKLDFQGSLDLDCFETLVLFISLELQNSSSSYADYFENVQDNSNDVLGKFEEVFFTLISKKNSNTFFILLLT